MVENITRRRWLSTLGIGSVATIAGCSSSETETPADDNTSAEAGKQTQTESSTGDGSVEDEAAVVRAEEYLNAFGTDESVAHLTYERGPASQFDVSTLLESTIHSVETTTVAEVVETSTYSTTDENIEQIEAEIEETITEFGADRYVLIEYVSSLDNSEDSERTKGSVTMVLSEGSWYVYSPFTTDNTIDDVIGFPTPRVSWSFDSEYEDVVAGDDFAQDGKGTFGEEELLTITHGGGAEIDGNRMSLIDHDGNRVDDISAVHSTLSAGDSLSIGIDNDDTIVFRYADESGETTKKMASYISAGA